MTNEEILALAAELDALASTTSAGVEQAAADALRQLVEERDREDRLLRAGWKHERFQSGIYVWMRGDKEGHSLDRAEAARMAEKKL